MYSYNCSNNGLYVATVVADVVAVVVSALLGNVKDADDTIATPDSKHLARVAKVSREARPGQVVDSVARFEELVAVEDFDFVAA